MLSPKHGPDVYVNNVQNRLSIYLYARLLWDPDQSMADILRDWCQTAFGKAAGPMVDYYTAMDRAWGAMPVHKGTSPRSAPSKEAAMERRSGVIASGTLTVRNWSMRRSQS